MITTIIFDLWNTLGAKNASFSTALKNNFVIKDEDFYKRYESSMMKQKWESMEAMAIAFLQEFDIETTRRNIQFIIAAQQAAINKSTPFAIRDLLEKLGSLYKLGVLSNTTCFESAVLQRWQFINYFEDMIFSWQTGLLKPDSLSFAGACKRLRTAPQECVFIDDNEENCAAAQAAGLIAIRFCDVAQLERELKRQKIL